MTVFAVWLCTPCDGVTRGQGSAGGYSGAPDLILPIASVTSATVS